MPVQMLGPRVALPAALVRTFKLLVQALPTPSPLSRRPRRFAALAAVAIVPVDLVAISSASSGFVAVRGGGGGWLGTARSVHLLGELCLAKVGRVPYMHGQYLRRHRGSSRGSDGARVVSGENEGCVAVAGLACAVTGADSG